MNKRRPTIALVLALASLSTAAAFEVPQTREEFVKAVAAGHGATAVEKLKFDLPLDKVYAVLEERAGACLDVTVKRTAYVGYVEKSSSDYNPTVRLVEKDRAEFTLQVVHNPRAIGEKAPPGGLIIMAADLESDGDGHTEIVLYRPTIGAKRIVESLKEWFAANPSSCPKLR